MKKKFKISFLLTKVIILITFVIVFRVYLSSKNNLNALAIDSLKVIESPVSFVSNIVSWFYDLFHFNKFRNNYLKLQEENFLLNQKLLDYLELKKENENLKLALKIKEEENWKLVPAKVVFFDPSGVTNNFLIDKGLENGIKNGMNIITNEKVLIGRTINCLKYSCLVESIFSPNVKIGLENARSKIKSIMEKDIKGNFYLKLLPPMADMEIGDLLITSNENPFYLKGLLVAKIIDKIEGAKNPEEGFIIEPLVNRLNLDQVFVITNFTF